MTVGWRLYGLGSTSSLVCHSFRIARQRIAKKHVFRVQTASSRRVRIGNDARHENAFELMAANRQVPATRTVVRYHASTAIVAHPRYVVPSGRAGHALGQRQDNAPNREE